MTGNSASLFLFFVVIVVAEIIYSKYTPICVNLELFIYTLSNYRLLRNVKLEHLLYYVYTYCLIYLTFNNSVNFRTSLLLRWSIKLFQK